MYLRSMNSLYRSPILPGHPDYSDDFSITMSLCINDLPDIRSALYSHSKQTFSFWIESFTCKLFGTHLLPPGFKPVDFTVSLSAVSSFKGSRKASSLHSFGLLGFNLDHQYLQKSSHKDVWEQCLSFNDGAFSFFKPTSKPFRGQSSALVCCSYPCLDDRLVPIISYHPSVPLYYLNFTLDDDLWTRLVETSFSHYGSLFPFLLLCFFNNEYLPGMLNISWFQCLPRYLKNDIFINLLNLLLTEFLPLVFQLDCDFKHE